jgi:hypothetical protein
MVRQNVERFRKCSPAEREGVPKEIIDGIARKDPPGRFLRQTAGGKFILGDSQWVLQKVVKSLSETRQSLNETKMVSGHSVMLPHEKDGAEFYVEERAFLYHDPPMPKAGVHPSEEAVSAEDLSPLPKAPRVKLPENPQGEWTFCEESRVLLINFSGVEEVSLAEKRAFAEMLQRDDITVVSEGLLEGIDKEMLTLGYIAGVVKGSHKFRRFQRDSTGDYVRYEEKKGVVTMKISDFREYLERRQRVVNLPSSAGEAEAAFSFENRDGQEVTVDVNDPLYLFDLDMRNRLPSALANFNESVKIPEILPGGKWCMMNEVLAQTLVEFVSCGARKSSHSCCCVPTI